MFSISSTCSYWVFVLNDISYGHLDQEIVQKPGNWENGLINSQAFYYKSDEVSSCITLKLGSAFRNFCNEKPLTVAIF